MFYDMYVQIEVANPMESSLILLSIRNSNEFSILATILFTDYVGH